MFEWQCRSSIISHDDVIKWKHFPRYWPFVRGIHRSPVNSPHKGQWRGSLMFSLICAHIKFTENIETLTVWVNFSNRTFLCDTDRYLISQPAGIAGLIPLSQGCLPPRPLGLRRPAGAGRECSLTLWTPLAKWTVKVMNPPELLLNHRWWGPYI